MAIASYDTLIEGVCAGNGAQDNFYMQLGTATAIPFTGPALGRQLYPMRLPLLPSLPGGKNYFAPTIFEACSSRANHLTLMKLVTFGSLDISGASGTFTDGSVAPTVTEGGVSRQIPSAVLCAVTTALNATPGTFTITYQDQDGNSAETTSALTLAASAAIGSAAFIPLNGTDWGAIDITAAARSAGTTPTGVLTFYYVEPICTLSLPHVGIGAAANFLTDKVRMVKLSASDSLAILGSGTAVGAIQGRINYLAV
jgi:hypothetical protein